MNPAKSSLELSPALQAACEELKLRIQDAWDAHEAMARDAVFNSPLGKLVSAFGKCESGNETHLRLVWLSFFVARRTLDCWEHHRAEPKPFEAVSFLRDWIAAGMTSPAVESPTFFERLSEALGHSKEPWREFAKPATPRFHEIPDCRYSEWASAADAVASTVQFCASADPLYAVYALGSADCAHDECALHGAGFRDWLIGVAIPIAWTQREMTAEEQSKFKNYDQEKVRRWRESGGG